MATNTFDPHGDDDLSLPPAMTPSGDTDTDLASHVIREKLDRIYAEEPDATQELAEAAVRTSGRSKHQQFMYNLGTSGKDLATIQTEWHAYYEGLPDKEKHAVWQEFYASQAALTRPTPAHAKTDTSQVLAKNKNQTGRLRSGGGQGKLRDSRSTKDLQGAIRDKVSAGGKLETKHHLQSLLFGLGMGLIAVIIFLFGFFNEVIIAPFIQPSRAAAETPLILSGDSVAPTAGPEVIIPKINVEIPVNYNQTSTNEADIENDLENGIVHYPTTTVPGQTGNAAFFGHSSNNIFNKGKYKFAFVLLHTLVEGDTFYLTYNGKVYVYKVITKKVVEPNEVGVLGPVPGQTATATLITCDPPGTSLHRLVVVGQQISPDPSGNSKADAQGTSAATNPNALPGNGPTLWGRFISTSIGKVMVVIAVGGACLAAFRQFNKQLSVQ
jgi:LPXTG-site transpeptidase (sortase) family protein